MATRSACPGYVVDDDNRSGLGGVGSLAAAGPHTIRPMGRPTWPKIVATFAAERELAYEPIGGLNPRDAPAALCVGGANRLTGELAPGFWGACCDADERRIGVLRRRTVPGAVLAKAHMPDLAEVIGAFNVESIEKRPDELLEQRLARKVEFESIEFNRRFLTTVPSEYDPVALRELFSPSFLDWVTTIDRQVEFGISDRQLWFLWGLRKRAAAELATALSNAGRFFTGVRNEMEEAGLHTFAPGPWHAGLEHFPAA